MPHTIEFTASFGDHEKQVELSYLNPGGTYHIYIDRRYQGSIVNYQGKWTVLLQKPETMSMDDKQAIEEIIEESNR